MSESIVRNYTVIAGIVSLVVGTVLSTFSLLATIYFANKVNKISEVNLKHTKINTQIAFLNLDEEKQSLVNYGEGNFYLKRIMDSKPLNDIKNKNSKDE